MANGHLKFLILLFFIFAFCLADHGVFAFGAGNIPSYAYMEGRAFRHGDIEDVLAELFKKAASGGLAGLISKGSKFGGLDIKRVYFGNWLRDYSQAVDIASLKKVQLQTIINLCIALGFLAHGYATHEFEVTAERLGVYLPIEHIDNPKGYGDGEDARQYHPMLRGPVDPAELEVDPRTGMKNYIANENGTWDTSKALVRRLLERCIQLGRQQRAQGRKQDEYEAYRLLGTAMHTLEDFPAHSNFCELSLVALGHTEVFTHIGDHVKVQAPNGKWAAPLVTGTFGSSDFIHSLLGEATDHLSEASVSDLNSKLASARSTATRSAGPGGAGDPSSALRDLLFTLPGGSGTEMSREMESIDRIRAGPAQGGKRPEDMTPQELHAVLWQVLTFRDSVVKKIEKTIEKIPGLGPLIEKLMDSIAVFVFTTLEPFLKPILQSATTGLSSASGEVIDNHDQYEVFNDPQASDPTHSFLSKDHFNLILNEPAGQIAKIIVRHTVTWVIKAWDNPNLNVRECTEDVLQCLFHPEWHDPSSKVQREMMQLMRNWIQGLGGKQYEVLKRLNKQSVRDHNNTRLAGDGPAPAPPQSSFPGFNMQQNIQGYVNNIPGVSTAQNMFGGGFPGMRRDFPGDQGGQGYPGQGPTQYTPDVSAPPSSGEASSFYGGTGQSPYGPPAGPPPGAPPYGSFAPPPGPPQHEGYNPGYAPSPSATFPGSSPGFPEYGAPSGYGGGYGAPPGPPPVGGYGTPPGPPPGGPGFPGANPYAQSGPPQFPGSPGGYPPPPGQPYQYGGGPGGW